MMSLTSILVIPNADHKFQFQMEVDALGYAIGGVP